MYPSPEETPDHPAFVLAGKSGVVTTIARNHLIEEAVAADCMLELLPALGEFVPARGRLFA